MRVGCPCKRGPRELVEHTKKTHKLREEPHNDVYLAGTLILDVPVSRTGRNKFLVLKLPSLGYFVMAV
jgi:hypothetical protein